MDLISSAVFFCAIIVVGVMDVLTYIKYSHDEHKGIAKSRGYIFFSTLKKSEEIPTLIKIIYFAIFTIGLLIFFV